MVFVPCSRSSNIFGTERSNMTFICTISYSGIRIRVYAFIAGEVCVKTITKLLNTKAIGQCQGIFIAKQPKRALYIRASTMHCIYMHLLWKYVRFNYFVIAKCIHTGVFPEYTVQIYHVFSRKYFVRFRHSTSSYWSVLYTVEIDPPG